MRERAIATFVNISFILLFAALFYTQVVRSGYYSRLSKNNSIRVIPIDGPRGDIFDRNGTLLVTNRLCFDAAVIYQEMKEKGKIVGLLSGLPGISKDDIDRSLEASGRRPFTPLAVAEDIEKDEAIALEEASFDVDGLVIETRSRRHYVYGESGCHVFGYLGEVTEEELEGLREFGYRPGDLVGRSGLERYYDRYLTGVDGGTQIEVDSRGRQTRVLGLKEPSSGKDLHLTIDVRLQEKCDKLLGGKRGAIIAMDPNSGEILALASHPAFDPNTFIRPSASNERLRLLKDAKGRPLVDRAISGMYPPGSVFKVVIAAAALESMKISDRTQVLCTGSYPLGTAKFNCWKEGGHGLQNLTDALMNSCNVFFYNAGRNAGVDAIEYYAKLFGFGRPSGIDLPDEARGIVPGRLWKRLHRNDAWYEGDTMNYSIGQGYLLVTPIQILDMMAAVANNGYSVKPFIVKRIGAKYVLRPKPTKIPVKANTIRKIREGLLKTVNDEKGTGRRARVDGALVAGKTGTAQNPQGATHAWFSGFAPFDDPKICVVVFLEHGGKGGSEPSEIASAIFQEAKAGGYI